MVLYRRNRAAGATYFLTLTLRDRKASTLVDHIDLLRAAFAQTRRRHPFTTDAVVVLPDHIHWLCRLPGDDVDYSTRLRLIKRTFTHGLLQRGAGLRANAKGEYPLWQRRFWEHTIRDETDWQRHVDYIHDNPVRHGLVSAVRDWPHSSFHRHVAKGLLDADWGGRMTSPDGQFGEWPG